ncbi:pentatricopeptide repeat-containing protein At4g21065-like [Aegilops tauschii subsp. strangulata]|uniref:DYW domain-containing protein n=1 Tax=Aegilops tauschii TaxID=37682 RepID=M8CJ29_AEGTA|nr:putative pentatricopeptide repeat-containing protein At5g40405 [Aegilops tauschii subsp. strangulata]
MQLSRLNQHTFLSLLKAAAAAAASASVSSRRLPSLHAVYIKLGFLAHTRVTNGFIQGYCATRRVTDARRVFDEMPRQDTVSFNSMIHGYAVSGDVASACRLFEQVPAPTPVTWTSMVAGLCRAGDVGSARRVFEKMPERDLVSWNAMISGHVGNRQPVEALCLFGRMMEEGFTPNRGTVVSALSACASAGALETGKWVHVFVEKNRLRWDEFLGTALVDMYAKCGAVELALEVFTGLRARNTCTWNAMINGLAMNGYSAMALDMFRQMELDGRVVPDEVTFVGVLLACSHGGSVDAGREHFNMISNKYGIGLILEHYACMVDLLARSGHLQEAHKLITEMPMKPDVVIWRALLGGCRLHKNVKMAEIVITEMEATCSGDHVLLSNLYAAVGRWNGVEDVRRTMRSKGIEKIPGCSSVEMDGSIHEFISGDKSHPSYDDIHAKLIEIGGRMQQQGHVTETTEVFYDIEDEEKEQALGHHSEKLAIAFGLIGGPPDATIRIVKNIRFCMDCHKFAKLVSKIYQREIVVRDRARFHHFRGGTCSCNDFW